jgi:O-antigen/teichoic acid export membrane protein
MRRLLINSTWLSAGFGLAQLLTALAYWLVARALGPAEFGRVAAYVGIAMLVAAAADLGFGSWVVRQLVRTESADLFATSLGVRLVVALMVAGVWLAATLALWLLGLSPGYAVLFAVWIGLTLLWSTILAPLQAAQRMGEVAIATVVERLVLVLAVLAAVALGQDAASLAIGLALGSATAMVVALALVDRGMRRITLPSVREIGSFLKASSGFTASSIALQVQRLDVAVVGAVAGAYTAGIYAAPSRLTNALGILPTAFSAALFPQAAREKGSVWNKNFIRSLAVLSVIILLIFTPIFVFSNQLVALFLGDEYAGSAAVLRVILVGMFFATINQPIAVTYQARGREHSVAVTFVVGVAIGLSATCIGAAAAGAVGAAMGFVALQLTILSGLAVLTVKLRSRPLHKPPLATNARV